MDIMVLMALVGAGLGLGGSVVFLFGLGFFAYSKKSPIIMLLSACAIISGAFLTGNEEFQVCFLVCVPFAEGLGMIGWAYLDDKNGKKLRRRAVLLGCLLIVVSIIIFYLLRIVWY